MDCNETLDPETKGFSMTNLKNLIASKRRYYSVVETIKFEDGTIVTKTTYPNLKF